LALAENPHPFTISGTGQPGTNNGISCNTGTVGPGPGGSVNANGSPFNTNITKTYAGNTGNPTASGPRGNGIPVGNAAHAVSQYDVACFQQAP
jgi:hypothetical protein